jgi:hypothetical protein
MCRRRRRRRPTQVTLKKRRENIKLKKNKIIEKIQIILLHRSLIKNNKE